jgi:NACHT domain
MQLLRRIDTANTEEHHRTRTKVINEQVKGQIAGGWSQISALKEITAKFEMLDVSDAEETKVRNNVRESILETLAYPGMTGRYEDIIEAFPETFNWAFEDSTPKQLPWNNLCEWLKASSGVYWISGKAGSGKSTLMKHIFDDARTRRYLEQWAADDRCGSQILQRSPLCLATFFFWNSGTPEQKSQTGLLRALLYQVLSFCPELISVVFPELWAKRYSDSIQGRSRSNLDEALTGRRLSTAFRKLTNQDMVPLKLCFLVDGLDEFYGDYEELASLFQMATSSPNVKICLSSRPWVIFEQIYASRPSMRLQDLTYSDIEHYVSSRFNNNSAFVRLQEIDPDSAVLLRDEVIEKAEGVFLWVVIVVRSLLLGIRNQDDIMILRQRLMSMPQTLEDLYLHLLSLIEPVYLLWASKAFQIVRAARELCIDDSAGPVKRTEGSTPLAISTFLYAIAEDFEVHCDGSNQICVIEKVSPKTTRTLTQESLQVRCAIIKTHLTARCAGLLEVPRFEQNGPDAPIQFLHRTARDFLHNEDKWSQMLQYTQDSAFEPHRALFIASVLELAIKTMDGSTSSGEIYKIIRNAMLYAWHMNFHNIRNDRETGFLDNLDQIMTNWDARRMDSRSKLFYWSEPMILQNFEVTADMAFLGLATLYGLANYIGGKLAQLDQESARRTASMLLHILLHRQHWPSNAEPPFERPEMVSTLLHYGADPNFRRADNSTPWSNMLWLCATNYNYVNDRITPTFVEIMKMLVLAGADPHFILTRVWEEDAETIVRNSVLKQFPDVGGGLLDEMKRQMSPAAA